MVVASITRASSSTTGSFSQVWALLAPSPAAMWMDRIVLSGSRRFVTRPPWTTDMNGSTMAISRRSASSLTARPVLSRVATVPGSDRQMRVSILPPSRPRAAISAAV